MLLHTRRICGSSSYIRFNQQSFAEENEDLQDGRYVFERTRVWLYAGILIVLILDYIIRCYGVKHGLIETDWIMAIFIKDPVFHFIVKIVVIPFVVIIPIESLFRNDKKSNKTHNYWIFIAVLSFAILFFIYVIINNLGLIFIPYLVTSNLRSYLPFTHTPAFFPTSASITPPVPIRSTSSPPKPR